MTATDAIAVTPELLVRYDRPGPRYTSYPTAPEWRDGFSVANYHRALADAATRHEEPLAMYVHIPFCHERCIFCGCNVVITGKEGVADRYLDYLEREIALAAKRLKNRRWVAQLHWGGGTPTYLNTAQIRRLMGATKREFEFVDGAEVALEIDPRVTTLEQI